jgi:hypothetical protein
LLKETLPLERAQMRIKLHLPKKEAKKLKEKIVAQFELKFENEDWTDDALLLVSASLSQLFFSYEKCFFRYSLLTLDSTGPLMSWSKQKHMVKLL